MTIQEAIKSGKPFRRKEWLVPDYLIIESGGLHRNQLRWERLPHEYYIFFEKDDILADDWEIKE